MRILALVLTLSLAVGGPTMAAHESYEHWADKASADWINGALQSSNSQYSEGEIVPQHFHTDGLTVGVTYAFNIYLYYYDPSKNVCGFDQLSQFNIDQSPTVVSGTAQDATPRIRGQAAQYFYDLGADITAVSGLFTSTVQSYVTVVFQATATSAEFVGVYTSLSTVPSAGAMGPRTGAERRYRQPCPTRPWCPEPP